MKIPYLIQQLAQSITNSHLPFVVSFLHVFSI